MDMSRNSRNSQSDAHRVQTHSGSAHRPAPDSAEHQNESAAEQSASSVHPIEPGRSQGNAGPTPHDGRATASPTTDPGAADARTSAASRSQQPGVLSMNTEGGQSRRHPDTPAGQHATGSFSESSETKKAG